jgi:hypothetical protein
MTEPEDDMIRIAATIIAICVMVTTDSSAFTGARGDYTMDIPEGWIVTDPCDSGSDGETDTSGVTDTCVLSADKNTIVHIRSFEIDASTTLPQLVEDFFEGEGIGSEWSGIRTRVDAARVKRWGGERGAQGFSSRMIDETKNCLLYVITRGHQCYYLSIVFNTGDAGALKKAEAMIDTFRILKR